MKTIPKLVRKVRLSKTIIFLMGLFVTSNSLIAAPTLLIDQSSSITGAADTLKAARIPVRNNAGVVSYWDVTLRFTADGVTGKPILAPVNTLVAPSLGLISAAFRAGKYKDIFGNVFTVTGPGATTAGRSNWNLLLTKPTASFNGHHFEGSWTTGAIAGHPIENKIKAQTISISAYSWGTVNNISTSIFNLGACSTFSKVVGYVQVGDKLVLHGFCNGNNVESGQFTLSQCSATNVCP